MEHGAESLAWSSCGGAGTEFGDEIDAEVGVGSSGLWDVAGPTASVLHSLAGPPVRRSSDGAAARHGGAETWVAVARVDAKF